MIKGAGKTGLLGALCLFLLLGSFRPLTASAAGETVAANDARIRYLGRWDITDGVASGYFESGLELALPGPPSPWILPLRADTYTRSTVGHIPI